MYLLETNLTQWIFGVLGGGTVGVVITSLIQWIRYRKRDKSVSAKTDAESDKLKAEAAEIKAKADVTVADAALKLAQRLSDECESTRKQLENAQHELDNTVQTLNRVTTQLHFVQEELNSERAKNAQIQERTNKVVQELEALKQEYQVKK
jgi:hypothetical protein